MEKADEVFAKETLALLERSGINIVSAEKEGGKFKAVFTVIGTSVKYTINAQKTQPAIALSSQIPADLAIVPALFRKR
jgi:hypothetical protein